jgi:outer membrane protein
MQKFILTFAMPLVLGSAILTSCDNKPKETTFGKPDKKTEPTAVAVTTNPEISDSALAKTDTSLSVTNTSTATGTAPKYGHINSADLIKIMPETKKAEASLKAYVKTLENQLGGLEDDYRKKISDYQAQEKTMVDAIKQTKIQALQNLEQQMQESQAMGQQKIAAKRETLFKPILDKAEKAIKDVGKENGYDYIFDTNSGAFVYSKDAHDVMPLVKTKLGLK